MSDEADYRARVAALAHQLRNPLSAIQGALDLLRDPVGAPACEQQEMLDLIERQVQAMSQIIDHAASS